MPQKGRQLLGVLVISQRSSCSWAAYIMHYLGMQQLLLTFEYVQALPSVGIPYPGSLIKAACHHLVAKGVVECYGIHLSAGATYTRQRHFMLSSAPYSRSHRLAGACTADAGLTTRHC